MTGRAIGKIWILFPVASFVAGVAVALLTVDMLPTPHMTWGSEPETATPVRPTPPNPVISTPTATSTSESAGDILTATP